MVVPVVLLAAAALPSVLVALDATRDIPILNWVVRRPVVRIALGLMAVPLLAALLLSMISLVRT